MRDAGVRRAVAFGHLRRSAAYSGCRQYREDIRAAMDAVPGRPEIDKIRGVLQTHPGFIGPSVANLQAALRRCPRIGGRPRAWRFTAHSIPLNMAKGAPNEVQLAGGRPARVAAGADRKAWGCGVPEAAAARAHSWLGPDVLGVLKAAAADGATGLWCSPRWASSPTTWRSCST